MEVIVRQNDNRIIAINNAGHGFTERNESKFEIVKIPHQDVDQHYKQTEKNEKLKEIYYPDDIQTYSAEKEAQLKLRGQTYASIAEIDTSRTDKKYLKVEKTIDGNNYSVWAYADYSLLLAYQNNDIEVGDIVIIEFIGNELDKCYAQGKVVGF